MKKSITVLLTFAMTAVVLSGCGGSETSGSAAASAAETTTMERVAETTETIAAFSEPAEAQEQKTPTGNALVRVGSLKGPTSMGLVHLMDLQDKGEAEGSYEFTMVTAADELLGQVASGNLDVALVPANVASVLYNKTNGGISVIDINTLGVLYIVASDDSITSIADLKGKTLYLTGKGTTPDYVIHYLLSQNGLSENDVTLEFKSEAAEVAAVLKEQPDAIGLLPQPFVTVACAQNENLKIVLNLTEEWEKVQSGSGSQLITGVTIVRNQFLSENPDAIATFLDEHTASTQFVDAQPEETAQLIAAAGIIEKAPIAQKALPFCNIVCITGQDMVDALSGYLTVLFEQNPASVGGALPTEDFYYIP